MLSIRQEIETHLKSSDWEVFASDETRMVLECLIRKAWLKKGKKSVVEIERSHEYQNYIGFLNQKTYRVEIYPVFWQDQTEILKATKKLLKKYPRQKICIVWDNAAFHKGEKIRAALQRDNALERVHLINFPPYAPDQNPIEHVWKWVKDQLSNKQAENFETLKVKFKKLTQSKKFQYSI